MSKDDPCYEGPKFWAVLVTIGVAVEGLGVLGVRFWVDRYSADALSVGPFLFVLCLLGIYIGAQVLHAAFNIEVVAGMSLSLLATMLGWFGLAAAAAGLLFLIVLGIYSAVRVPARLLAGAVRSGRRRRA